MGVEKQGSGPEQLGEGCRFTSSGLDPSSPVGFQSACCSHPDSQLLGDFLPVPETIVGGSFTPVLSPTQSKRKFERDCREAEKAAQTAERLDQDINATKADVEKVPVGSETGLGVRVRQGQNWAMTLPPPRYSSGQTTSPPSESHGRRKQK